MEFLVVDDVDICHTLPEHREVEVLIAQVDIDTVREIGYGIEDPGTVCFVDFTVTIEVSILQTAHAGTSLTMGQHFLTRGVESLDHIADA